MTDKQLKLDDSAFKIIHINKNIIQQNEKRIRNGEKPFPPCRVEVDGKVIYGTEIRLDGASTMVYRPDKPRPCGAKLWIETCNSVTVCNPITWKELKGS